MRIDRFLAPNRIVDLKSGNFHDALLELLALFPPTVFAQRADAARIAPADSADTSAAAPEISRMLEKLMARERTLSTHLDSPVAMPHVRVPLAKKYAFAVGRCPEGFLESADGKGRKVRIIFLVLASDKEVSYHAVLATLAGIFEDKNVVQKLENATSLKEFRDVVSTAFKGVSSRQSALGSRLNQLMLREADKIARGADCSTLLLFGDTFSNPARISRRTPSGLNIVVASRRDYEFSGVETGDSPPSITVRAYANSRLAQLRSALLLGIMNGLIKPDERVCCLGGVPGSDKLDFILAVDLVAEFPSILSSRGSDLLPAGVKAEVLERALGIAMELSVEGREGRPVGCILVIGDRDKIKPLTRPLILNPFFGYSEEDRNILSPFMEETVKELASIDGAFVIHGDGSIESAGSMLSASTQDTAALPGGLGTRHAAANAISAAVDCIAIAVSSSTGQVTLFRRGEPLTLLERADKRGEHAQ